MYNKGYKYRLKLNKSQISEIDKIFGCTRYVFNYFLNAKINF